MQTVPLRLFRALSLLVIVAFVLAACDSGSPAATPTAQAVPPTPMVAQATDTAAPAPPSNTAVAAAPTSMATTAAASGPIYVSVIWHQHQPFYYKDPTTGVYERPWVRMHGIKDYLDMLETAEKYNAHVTINLTPSLIRQLDDFASGAKDKYLLATEKPAASLTDEDKVFMLRRFFDANGKIIRRFPRYAELQAKRGSDTSDAALQAKIGEWQGADWRDLQVLFNLGWTDPDFLLNEPFKAMVTKGKGFTEEEKAAMLAAQLEIIKRIIPAHKEAIARGIEIITTPYAHPILPLIADTNLSKQGLAGTGATQPTAPFSYPDDAATHVQLAKDLYKEKFGSDPAGMWPAEGSVAQEIVKDFADAGVNWIASDEMVLARSFGITTGFERDSSGTIKQADSLYKPYKVQDGKDGKPVYILFRDHALSDEVGFNYSGQPGEQASDNMIRRIKAAQTQIATGKGKQPALLTVLLDGENAWENYDNDGKDFLNSMYRKLTTDPNIKLVTPSEYFKLFPEATRIPKLYPGSWIDGTFSTWIGEAEENQAWDYLRTTREFLDPYIKGEKQVDPAALERAKEAMRAAEGSDWFWWFGDDQDSGDDGAFDQQYRDTLRLVYTSLLGDNDPLTHQFLSIPIVTVRAPAPARPVSGEFTVTVDGTAAAGEWDKAGQYKLGGGAMASGEGPAFYFGSDAANLNFRIDSQDNWSGNGEFSVYVATPAQTGGTGAIDGSTIPIGFSAGFYANVRIVDGKIATATMQSVNTDGRQAVSDQPLVAAVAGRTIELTVPWSTLGKLATGDKITMQAFYTDAAGGVNKAPNGAFTLNVPDRNPINFFLTVDDPKGDDHGPGTYTYAQNAVFKPGNFDFAQFQVGLDGEDNMVFRFKMYGPTDNPWGGPSGLALQSYDIYVDTDGKDGSGARKLLMGRNAAVSAAQAWDVAVKAEGWPDGQAIYKGSATADPAKVDAKLKIQVDATQQVVTVRVPKSAFGDGDPATWSYLAVVMSQDGPATASGRIRDVQPTAAEWKLGGAPDDTNHTRIIDAALPADLKPTQEESLKDYAPSKKADKDLTADELPKLPLVPAKK